MTTNIDDLKFQLAQAALEAANTTKNAVNLSVTKAQAGDYQASGSISAMAANCSTVARDLTHALAELEAAYPTPPA